jgi:hypothetical protein
MHLEPYACKICDYGMDQPVDACPICGEPFYWRVVPALPLQENQRTAFLQTMEDLSQGEVSREFLSHGNHLWLPYHFWQIDPRGEWLDGFPWIGNLALVQHENAEKRDFYQSRTDLEERADGQGAAHDIDTQPLKVVASPVHEPGLSRPRPAPAQQGGSRMGQRGPMHALSARRNPGSAWPLEKIFAPLMVALFLLFLGFGYLNLLRCKNQLTGGGARVGAILP